MRRSLLLRAALLGALSFSTLACKPAPPAAAVPAVRTFEVKGEIQGFQSDNKVIILKHEAIPTLMEGMTMGFELKDPAIAKGYAKGDKVVFTLAVSVDSYLITALKKQ